MMFGAVPVAEAAGAILAHAVRDGAIRFKKGRVLSDDDVRALLEAGLETVMAARLEAGDVPEDEAAAEVAAALIGDGLTPAPAFTGRCNLHASAVGLAVIDVERLNRVNAVHEAITVATLPPFHRVEPKQMVATVKIILFAAPASSVAACKALAVQGGAILRVAALRPRSVGLIQTRLPGIKGSVLAATAETTRARIAALGSTLVEECIVAHDPGAVADALAGLADRGCDPILILGASAIVDRRDVIPAAVVALGGAVVHFGMPVDPGNLLMLGRIGTRSVVGLPGCARSPKLNGFDWVLERLLAGLPVDSADIMGMGAGGLLTEIASRPMPRKKAGGESVPATPAVAAVVLAAGRSTRMGGGNKLLAEAGGTTVIEAVVRAAVDSRADPVIVVVGHEDGRVRGTLAGYPVTFVENPDYARGLSTSVRAGAAAVPEGAGGALFLLGDMPRVRADHIDALIAAFDPAEGRAICVPTHRAKRGNPVLWGARFLPELRALSGDVGARALFGRHADLVCEVELDDDGVLVDIDTPEALAALTTADASRRA